ncbi:MAG: hypothetical protein WBI40_08790, partial [Methylococcaceae bacterium]
MSLSAELFFNLLTKKPYYERLQDLLTNKAKGNNNLSNEMLLFKLPLFISQVGKLNRSKYHYDSKIEVFADCVARHPFKNTFLLETVCKYPSVPEIYYPELEHTRGLLSVFLSDLHEQLLALENGTVTDYEQQMDEEFKFLCKYTENVFAISNYLDVIEVILYYENDVEIEDVEQNLFKLHDDTCTLVNVNSNNKLDLFSYLEGYIWKIEYSLERGFHVHALFFYDENKRKCRSAMVLAKSICNHWTKSTTTHNGFAFNCNDGYNYDDVNNPHRRFSSGGIEESKIHISRSQMVTNLTSIIKKFCQLNQFVKPIDNPNFSLIRTKALSEYKECDSVFRAISEWKPY